MKIFKLVDGTRVNIVKHTLLQLKANPTVQVHIGTDSQNMGCVTKYSTVIAYRFTNKGVHYISHDVKVPKINDIWNRLWKEAEMSIKTAEWLTNQINVNVQIDMDYNKDRRYRSSKIISATKGWANSLGYKVNIKPNKQIATRAADRQCNKPFI